MDKLSRSQKKKLRNALIDSYQTMVTKAMLDKFDETKSSVLAYAAGDDKMNELIRKNPKDRELIITAVSLLSQELAKI